MHSKTLATALGSASVMALLLTGCSSGATGSDAPERKPFGECDVTDTGATHELDTVTEGVLTIAVPWPSPSGYPGESPDKVEGGYLYCLTAEIAKRAGLDEIKIETTSFEALITARTHNYDLSLWDVIVTPEREKVVDFATPYMKVQTGVAVRAEDEDMSHEDMKDARIGFLAGSKAEQLVNEKIKPTQSTRTFQGNDDMFNALLANQIDVAMNDTITLMPWAHTSSGKGVVVGQYRTDSPLAPVLPKDSPNTEPVSAILDEMNEDGTTEAVLTKWLYEGYGGNPEDIPYWDAE